MEQRIARIASTQHGVVTWARLREAEISEKEIRRRIQIGALIREYRGVYRVGHRAPSIEASYLAAVCACGNGALLRCRAAGYLLGLLKRIPRPAPEVLTLTERKIEGIATRRTRSIHPLDRATHNGVPVTPVPRTLVDLAEVLTEDQLARACHEAGVLYETTPKQVEAALARRPNRPGARALQEVLGLRIPVTLSDLEEAFLKLLRDNGLPLPITNRRADARRVDCRWPEYRLTVELDSYRFHNSRYSWEQDRKGERGARKRGDAFRRFTYGDVTEDPEYVLGELRVLLGRDLQGDPVQR